jgi:tRNA threonylcarbamoyladenosine biosynthesis protein TsaE
MIKKYSLNQLPNIAKEVINNSKYKILLFHGEMGVGKTTLIKEIVKQLGSLDIVSSPTFSLVNEYHTPLQEVIYHFDFYRITTEEEALDIGIEDYFYNNQWCLIEWPNKVENLLPLKSTIVTISNISDSQNRMIELKNNE